MKTNILNFIIILLIFAMTIVAIALLPDGDIPMHFDINGNVNREGSKYELLIIPIVVLLIQIIADKSIGFFTKKNDNEETEKLKSDANTNKNATAIAVTVTSVVMAVVNALFIYSIFSHLESYNLPEIDIVKFVVVIMGFTMIAMGNFMPKTRANSLIGFRCSWTMYNDNTWRKSNLFAGIVMMIMGVLLVVEGFIFKGVVAALIMIVLLVVFIPMLMIYAYRIYVKEKMKND